MFRENGLRGGIALALIATVGGMLEVLFRGARESTLGEVRMMAVGVLV